jgi:hypothetical protein
MFQPEIIVDGNRYTAADPNPNRPDNWKGFGGRHFTVKYLDGTSFRTDDLMWIGGSHKPSNATLHEGWILGDNDAPQAGWKYVPGEDGQIQLVFRARS